MTQKDIQRVLTNSFSKADVAKCVNDLTLKHFLVGAISQKKNEQVEEKKRDLKSKMKQEPTEPQEVPLRLNFSKFIVDERQNAII